jgi:hypothetical protein
MEMVNPLAAFREGQMIAQGLFDQRTQRQAGNALAQGDYQGGANALIRGGMIEQGQGILQYDQKNRQMQAEQERAMQEQAKAAQVQSLKTMLGGAQSLLQAPPEQRAEVYRTSVRPLLKQQGVPPELLAKFDTSGLTDQELQPFVTTLGGELQKTEWQIVNPGGGQQAYAVDKADPSNFRPVGPVGPEGRQKAEVVEGPDGLYERQADGSWKQVAKFGAAPKVFAPRAPRGSGRGGGSGTAAPAPPPGFVLD